jgi:hypothetical protein
MILDIGAPVMPGGGMGGMDYQIRRPQVKRRKPGISCGLFLASARFGWFRPTRYEVVLTRAHAVSRFPAIQCFRAETRLLVDGLHRLEAVKALDEKTIVVFFKQGEH